MAYSADTFVADEQPTTAKWNKLWSNDASFNDGTGIATGAITSSKISGLDKSLTTTDSNPYKFSAYHNTTQSLGSGVVVGFNTELFDTNSNYDGTNKYTAPVSGFYFVNFTVYIQAITAGANRAELYLNGAVFKSGLTVYAGTDAVSSFSDIVQMTAADYIQVYTNITSPPKTIYGQAAAPRYSFFSAFLVSRT